MTIELGARPATMCEVFAQTVARLPQQVALRGAEGGQVYTYATYLSAVADAAAALYGCGVRRGDVVALMFENRPEFHVFDAAVMHLGAITCSIYNTSPRSDIAHIIESSGARIALCEGKFAPGLSEAAPDLTVICTESGIEHTLFVAGLRRPDDFDFDVHRRAVQPDDVLTLIFTSGTTGKPKPVELTHRSMIAEILLAAEVLDFRPGDRVPSALPMAHAAQRWGTHYNAMAFGLEVVCIADLSTLAANLVDIQPDIWGAVPRILEKMVGAVRARLDAEPDPSKRSLAGQAIEVGQRYAAARLDIASGGRLPDELIAQREAVEPILANMRAAMGLGRLRWLMVGAAPTAPHVHDFLAGLGLEVVEVWGMSELTSVATINPCGLQRPGTVGKALRDVEITLADDGEILVRGPIVMRGYRGQHEATTEAFTSDGRLRTGDLGSLDADGYLSITGRKKEIIVNAAGKNISPAKVEAAVKAESRLIGSVMAVGDARPFVTALLVLDPDALVEVAAQQGLQDGSADAVLASEKVYVEIADAVTRANTRLARAEQIKKYVVLKQFWLPGSDELTPTLKLKRRAIAEKYSSEIDALYGMAAVR
ncbi:AMP-dependent synthetase/ligase [Mycobacteroides abscessus]|uniref:AMP-dependent synthetase/ligase n=1 Tax=Mycobacteroides abscessus TaxID=36809 RepID=UPI000D96F10E|nr:AMP-binding protein [Mycobacteroides abscessus]SPX87969.1 fatty-acid--CoA ligase [Mycobacteroides abscessus]